MLLPMDAKCHLYPLPCTHLLRTVFSFMCHTGAEAPLGAEMGAGDSQHGCQGHPSRLGSGWGCSKLEMPGCGGTGVNGVSLAGVPGVGVPGIGGVPGKCWQELSSGSGDVQAEGCFPRGVELE